jgi:hypothetical protein
MQNALPSDPAARTGRSLIKMVLYIVPKNLPALSATLFNKLTCTHICPPNPPEVGLKTMK